MKAVKLLRKNDPKTTIKALSPRLFTKFFLLGFIPALVVTITSILVSYHQLTSSNHENLTLKASQTYLSIEEMLENMIKGISRQTHNASFAEYLAAQTSEAKRQQANNALMLLQTEHSEYNAEYALYDNDGQILLSTIDPSDFNISYAGYFKLLKGTQQIQMSVATPQGDKLYNYLISPIHNENRNLLGYLRARFPTAAFSQQVAKRLAEEASAYPLVFDSSFQLVATQSDSSFHQLRQNSLFDQTSNTKSRLYELKISSDDKQATIIKADLSINGSNKQVTAAVLMMTKYVDWVIFYAVENDALVAQTWQYSQLTLLMLIFVSIMAFVVAMFASKQVSGFLSRQKTQVLTNIESATFDEHPATFAAIDGDAGEHLNQLIGKIKKANQDLQKQLDILRHAQSTAGIANIVWDINSQTIEFSGLNNLFAEVSSALTFGEPDFMALFDSKTQHKIRSFVLSAAIGDQNKFETMLSLSSEQVIVEVRMEKLLSEQSHPMVLGNVTDISERQQARRELRLNEERLSLALQASNSGMWDWDVITDKVYYSPRWFTMLGYLPGELEANLETFQSLLHEDDKEAIFKQINDLLAGERIAIDFEIRMRTKDNSYRWVYSRGAPVGQDKDGLPTRIVGTHTDITAQKESEQLLIELNERLESKVDHRTQQLETANNELLKARDKAEAANVAKSYFLANMSHEIRTPMNAITGLTNLALKHSQDEKISNYLRNISSSSQNLLIIINDILDFSKIEAGKLEIEKVNFSLVSLLSDLSEMFAFKAREHNVEFIIHTEPNVPLYLIGDPTRIYQVLTNLCSNAFKFTTDGQILVSLELIAAQDDKATIQFTVQDSGIGIPIEKQKQLFKAFTQADVSTTRKFGGTGLGLTICKQLVELMSGSIDVTSEVNVGSEFYFTVPFRVDTAGHEKELALKEKKHFILVLHESDLVLDSLSDMLLKLGYHSDSCSKDDDALELLKSGRYDACLLSDCFDNDQEDTPLIIEKIRELPDKTRLPIILTGSADDSEEHQLDAVKHGANGYLSAPVTLEKLNLTMADIFDDAPLELQESTYEFSKDDNNLEGLRVMLVEDNEVNQMVATELLTFHGAEVTIANHGLEAVEFIQEKDFDVIIMDIQMPVMDGYEATRTIRRMPKYQSIPIIAMTANAMQGDKEKCLLAGMNEHIAKPIEEDVLLRALSYIPRRNNTEQSEKNASIIIKNENESSGSSNQKQQEVSDMNTVTDKLLVNLEFGLKQLSDNKELLFKMFDKFSQDYQQAYQQIKELVQQSDFEAARQLAHTIKGVAGNLGLQRLHQASANFEAELKNEQTSDTLLEEFHLALIDTFSELEQVTQPKPTEAVAAETTDDTAEQLQKMEAAINNNEFIGDADLKRFVASVKGTVNEQALTAFTQALDNFDYDSAKEHFIRFNQPQ